MKNNKIKKVKSIGLSNHQTTIVMELQPGGVGGGVLSMTDTKGTW